MAGLEFDIASITLWSSLYLALWSSQWSKSSILVDSAFTSSIASSPLSWDQL